MSLQATRQVLANLAPDGFNKYPYVHGSPTAPALVVGLPDNIDVGGTFTHARVRLPLTVTVLGKNTEQAETALMNAVSTIANGLASFPSSRIEGMRDFNLTADGAGNSLSAVIDVSFMTTL